MNYFDYNQASLGVTAKQEPEYETLTFTGDETIDVTEDHTMTVDDVREFIRSMNAHAAAEAQRAELSGNVVSLRKHARSA